MFKHCDNAVIYWLKSNTFSDQFMHLLTRVCPCSARVLVFVETTVTLLKAVVLMAS